MMYKIKFFVTVIFFLGLFINSSFAQDTLNILYYNILNFPNSGNTDPDGNDAARVADFSDIIEEADADIVLVEELRSTAGADMLLTGLNNNTNGKTFARAPQYFQYGSQIDSNLT